MQGKKKFHLQLQLSIAVSQKISQHQNLLRGQIHYRARHELKRKKEARASQNKVKAHCKACSLESADEKKQKQPDRVQTLSAVLLLTHNSSDDYPV